MRMYLQKQILPYILLFFAISLLQGCGGMKSSFEPAVTQLSSTNLGELVILNQNQFYPKLRKALIRVGFKVPPFASNSKRVPKGNEFDTTFAEAKARIGIRHTGILSAFNPCLTNKNAANFKEYKLQIIDLDNNETLMIISSGGWTESCPANFLTTRHSNNLFGDLANGLAQNYKKIFSD